MKKFLLPVLFFIAASLTWFACRKESVTSDPASKLSFSESTILFDTVFTTVGSSTQWLQVFNPHNKKLVISSIRLGNGSSSMFKINVNGKPGREFSNVEIAAKDSMFIFIEVRVDPQNANTPMVVTDSITFETNGNIQVVKLVAWGQDAYFHTPLRGSYFSRLHFCPEFWNNDKPHVIYGYFVVDSSCTLTINAGVQVYIHNQSGMLVYKDGTLKIKGTLAQPVVIQGDRREASFKDVPGQWDRIWLYPGCINNEINYAIIKNGNVGIQADTIGNTTAPDLLITNSIIKNMAGAGLYAQGSSVWAGNCVFGDCGIQSVLLSIGGDYQFYHCTFANYWNQDTRQTPMLGLNNYYEAANGSIQVRDLTRAYFGNCIFYGKQDKEIGFDYKTSGAFNYKFDYCLLKSDSEVNTEMVSFPLKYNNILKDQYPLFTDTMNNDYSILSGSPAIDAGSPGITSVSAILATDIKGNSRGGSPDMGAYEK